MSETTAATHARELLTIWEQAICIGSFRALLPPDLAHARARLAKFHPDATGRHLPHQLFFFYRIGALILHQPTPPTMRQFSESLGVPLSSATRVVEWLVRAGYLARQTDARDRRVVRVTMTREGEKIYRLIGAFIRQRMEQLMHQFTAQERKNFVALSRKLVATLAALDAAKKN